MVLVIMNRVYILQKYIEKSSKKTMTKRAGGVVVPLEAQAKPPIERARYLVHIATNARNNKTK